MSKTRRFLALALMIALVFTFVPATLAVDGTDFSTADDVIVTVGKKSGSEISIVVESTGIDIGSPVFADVFPNELEITDVLGSDGKPIAFGAEYYGGQYVGLGIPLQEVAVEMGKNLPEYLWIKESNPLQTMYGNIDGWKSNAYTKAELTNEMYNMLVPGKDVYPTAFVLIQVYGDDEAIVNEPTGDTWEIPTHLFTVVIDRSGLTFQAPPAPANGLLELNNPQITTVKKVSLSDITALNGIDTPKNPVPSGEGATGTNKMYSVSGDQHEAARAVSGVVPLTWAYPASGDSPPLGYGQIVLGAEVKVGTATVGVADSKAYLLASDGTSTFNLLKTGYMGPYFGQSIANYTSARLTFFATEAGTYTITVKLYDVSGGEVENNAIPRSAAVIATSNELTVTVYDPTPGATPAAVINYVSETLTGLTANAAYTVNGVAKTANSSGEIAIEAAWFGETVEIIKKGNGTTTADSTAQSLPIPSRPNAPAGLGSTNATDGQNNASITGVTNSMEYRRGTSGDWTAVTGTTVTGLRAGDYYVRYKAATTTFASKSASLSITTSVSPPSNPSTSTDDDDDSDDEDEEETTIPGDGGTDETDGEKVQIPVDVDTTTGTVTVTLDDDTTDELIEDALNAAEELSAENPAAVPVVTLDLSAVEEAKTVQIDVNAAEALSEAEVSITVKLPDGEVTLDPGALSQLAETTDIGTTPVTIEAGTVPMRDLSGLQAAQVKGYETVVNIDVYVGNDKVDVPVTVSLPYKLKPNEDPAAVCVWYLDDKGSLTKLAGVYDEETGMVTFMVTHQSYFVVGYDPVALWENVFTDIIHGDWFYDAVAYANYYGYVDGNENMFKPFDNFSRATFVTLIWKLEGNPVANGALNFSDVPAGLWYTDAVYWAAEQGIVTGTGNGFNPSKLISRQEMITMLYNYLQYKGYDIPAYQVSVYEDGDSVDAWAESAVKELADAGVLNGFVEDILNPEQNANRAELAQLFMDFLRLIAGR